jgi:hypothetical protein
MQYWHERMMAFDVAVQSVPVRFEPYDMGVAYAYIDDQWLECVADAYAQVRGRSENGLICIIDRYLFNTLHCLYLLLCFWVPLTRSEWSFAFSGCLCNGRGETDGSQLAKYQQK